MGLVFSNDFFWLENNTYLNLLGFVLIFGFLKLDLNLLRGWGERGAEAGGHRSPPSRGCDSTWIANQGARRQGLAQGKVVRWHVLAVLSAAGHCHQRPGKQGPAVVSSTQLETPATPNGRASLSPASEALHPSLSGPEGPSRLLPSLSLFPAHPQRHPFPPTWGWGFVFHCLESLSFFMT